MYWSLKESPEGRQGVKLRKTVCAAKSGTEVRFVVDCQLLGKGPSFRGFRGIRKLTVLGKSPNC